MPRLRSILFIFLSITATGRRQAVATGEALIDLSRAAVVTRPDASDRERTAARLLVDEVARRSGVRLSVAGERPAGGSAIVVETRRGGDRSKLAADGFEIRSDPEGPVLSIEGNDDRGALFGVGRLLRELRTTPGKVQLPGRFHVATSPRFALRGHQLGYRPKTNSYDAWDLPQWDRYIRDLVIFGTNAVELIPPRSDDDADSPHFPRPPIEMLAGMSRILDGYGLDVWLWYPALDSDYSDPRTVAAALIEWGEVFRKVPRLDALFVPGGDPGHTPPKVLLPFLEKVAAVLHRWHPAATLWVSPQGFDQQWLDDFLTILTRQQPAWLTGVVHGPQVRISLAELRKAIPQKYPIRSYPDITHSQQCQFPVPDWDVAYSLTEGREVINPRPRGEAAIFRYYQPGSIGFITYSEGCNDDVNKFVWSGLGWDPDADVVELLRQYTRAFLAEGLVEQFPEGLLALEANWQGPLWENQSVEQVSARFAELEHRADPELRKNWRFQQALYRAYYDNYVRRRLVAETRTEEAAYRAIASAPRKNSLAAIRQAEAILRPSPRTADLEEPAARIRGLADELFVSIRMQLSVPLYDAIAVDRGANLDTLEVPLNDRIWLHDQLDRISRMDDETERQRALDALAHRTDPGRGGYYDDLGNLRRQPHLVRAPESATLDPDFRHSALVGFGSRAGWPLAWCQNAQTLYDAPLRLHYDGLDPAGAYRVRVVYAGDSFRNKIRLDAEEHPVHDWFQKPNPPVPVEFDVPPSATADGKLTLSWRQEPGKGRNGRGCQVAEVWLIKK
jgi:hypothetical protein